MMMRGLYELMGLAEQVALVAGAHTPGGHAAARALAELGAHVALAGEDRACETLAARLASTFGVTAWHADLSGSPGHPWDLAVARAAERFRRLDKVVFVASDPDDLAGFTALARAAAPRLERAEGGAIVAVAVASSIDPGDPTVCPVLDGISDLARKLAPGVRVNGVRLGVLWDYPDPAQESRCKAATAMGRMARPEDLMGAVAYLASNLSAHVTGRVLVVDGGFGLGKSGSGH